MKKDVKRVNLIAAQGIKTATTVEVSLITPPPPPPPKETAALAIFVYTSCSLILMPGWGDTLEIFQ